MTALRISIVIVCSLMLSVDVAASPAATGSGVLKGTVRDQTGAPLPGVSVVLHDEPNRLVQEAVTDQTGSYTFIVTPRRYHLGFELINFTTAWRRDVDVAAGQSIVVDAALHLSLRAEVSVTGQRTFRNLADTDDPSANLVGLAEAASQGAVTAQQIELRPIARPGDVIETVPGLIVSQHSGEGKANQFFLRGFNLDHGTDFATTVAGIPVNMPTHGHGHGYSDLNFLIPELVNGVQFKKGPYFADEGDFAAAGAANINYASVLAAPILLTGAGAHGWGRVVGAISPRLGSGHLLTAFEANRSDGPWTLPSEHVKTSGVLRYTLGTGHNSLALTAMTYRATWNSTDQIPLRAIRGGVLSRFDAVDPSAGGSSYRHSGSIEIQRAGTRSLTRATGFVVGYGLDLFSNFTYFLDDAANGDQFEQIDRRLVTGLRVSHARQVRLGTRLVEHRVGLQLRNDDIGALGLYKTHRRTRLAALREDVVGQTSAGLWTQTDVQWANWLRTSTGLRADGYRFNVNAGNQANSGRRLAGLVSPKLALVLGPWRNTEWYVNAGAGFHSNDARGATITADPSGEPIGRVTPIARARGAELGLRTVLVPGMQTTVAVWHLGLDSELVFVGDAGTTHSSRPSNRHGIEWSTYARLGPCMTADVDVAWSKARFADADPSGAHIPGAAERVASAGISFDRGLGLVGSVRWRYVGRRPLIEDGSVRSEASRLVNAELSYPIAKRFVVSLEMFNVLNARANDIEYFYRSRLAGESSSGVTDLHIHPAQPRTIRFLLRVSR